MNLTTQIYDRLRAGALVVLVEDPDEFLARAAALAAAAPFEPVREISAGPELLDQLERPGTMIVGDCLRIFGDNPLAVRLIREIALQQEPVSRRLVLLEVPGVPIPATLQGDLEVIRPAAPGVPELLEELDGFVDQRTIDLPGNGELRYAIASAVAGLPRHEACRLFARSWTSQKSLDVAWLRREKAERVATRLGGALVFCDPSGAADLGGLEALRGWLRARKSAFGSQKAAKYGLPEPKGVLLLGPPGTGKSLTAKVIAREWGLKLLRLDPGRLFGSLVGQSESQCREALAAAEACAPCVLWIDEIDRALGSGGLDGGTSDRVVSQILTWLQEKTAPVFVVGTCNTLPKTNAGALNRKGRFDEIFFVDLPSAQDRQDILGLHITKRARNPEMFDLGMLAQASPEFSGAELEAAVLEAAVLDGMFTAFGEDREVTTADILGAIRRTTPLATTMAEEISALRKWAVGRTVPAGGPVPGPGASPGPNLLRRAMPTLS